MVQFSLGNVTSGNVTPLSIVDVVASPSAQDEVAEGTKIEAIYIEMWVSSVDGVQSSCVATVEKRPSGLGAMNAAESASLNSYDNKKNVLHTFQGLLGASTSSPPMPVIHKWVKIPKGKQRFGIGDKLVLNILAQSRGTNHCGFAVYKAQN